MTKHAMRIVLAAAATIGTAGCAHNPARSETLHPSPDAVVLGDFTDDYGGTFTISASDWFQRPGSHYRILAWHPDRHYLIAHNDERNRSSGGKWTRIDWVYLADQGAYTWAFCFTAYKAESATAAETATADVGHPRTGCNGFPFSRMRPGIAARDGS